MIHRKKLLHSKWTAVHPKNKEKHFIVTQCFKEKNDQIQTVKIQAVHSKRDFLIEWHELKNSEKWLQGWLH